MYLKKRVFHFIHGLLSKNFIHGCPSLSRSLRCSNSLMAVIILSYNSTKDLCTKKNYNKIYIAENSLIPNLSNYPLCMHSTFFSDNFITYIFSGLFCCACSPSPLRSFLDMPFLKPLVVFMSLF